MMQGRMQGPRLCLNIGCGKVLKTSSGAERWINVDRVPLPGVDQTWNAFTYPWPVASDMFDHVYASHLIEHIPHTTRIAPEHFTYVSGTPFGLDPSADQRYEAWLRQTDGFFAFFSEVWRVLKPGGTVLCIAPYGLSVGAMQDPTHTRFIVPETILYLVNHSPETFDYELPFRFSQAVIEPVQFAVNEQYQHLNRESLLDLASHQFNVVTHIIFTLEKLPLWILNNDI